VYERAESADLLDLIRQAPNRSWIGYVAGKADDLATLCTQLRRSFGHPLLVNVREEKPVVLGHAPRCGHAHASRSDDNGQFLMRPRLGGE
jgi:hypothetical protein